MVTPILTLCHVTSDITVFNPFLRLLTFCAKDYFTILQMLLNTHPLTHTLQFADVNCLLMQRLYVTCYSSTCVYIFADRVVPNQLEFVIISHWIYLDVNPEQWTPWAIMDCAYTLTGRQQHTKKPFLLCKLYAWVKASCIHNELEQIISKPKITI